MSALALAPRASESSDSIPTFRELEELNDALGVATLHVEDVATTLANVRRCGETATLEDLGGIALFAERVHGDARQLLAQVDELRGLVTRLAPGGDA